MYTGSRSHRLAPPTAAATHLAFTERGLDRVAQLEQERREHKAMLQLAAKKFYAGAAGRWTLPELVKAGPRWAAMPKLDGCYATVLLDDDGCIRRLVTRKGVEFGEASVGELVGQRIGAPRSVLVGELEAMTEASQRAIATRGYPLLHLFDAIRIGDEDLSGQAFSDRRDALYRMHMRRQEADDGRPWLDDFGGRAHAPSGKFCSRVTEGWRRAPIVEIAPAAQAEELWNRTVEQGGGEGIVAVRLDARLGLRGAKKKIKPVHHLDVTILESDERAATAHWIAADVYFAVGCGGKSPRFGEVWELRHEGFYDSGAPKFPRLVRRRDDLKQ